MSPQQVEWWLGGSTTNPNDVSKKAKLNTMLVKIEYKASREAFVVLPSVGWVICRPPERRPSEVA
jgi:hypothetical protein